MELRLLATSAAEAAAKVIAEATVAASKLALTAAQAAHTLAESSRIELVYVREGIDEIKMRLDNKFVTMDAFEPVRKLAYGLAAVALTGMLAAVLRMVMR